MWNLLLSIFFIQIVPKTRIKFYANSLRHEPRENVLHESPWMKLHMDLAPRLLADIDVEAASETLKAVKRPDSSPEQLDAAVEFMARNLDHGVPRGFKQNLVDYVIRAAQQSARKKLNLQSLRRSVERQTLGVLNSVAAGRQNVRRYFFDNCPCCQLQQM